jgi:hypothetical protein
VDSTGPECGDAAPRRVVEYYETTIELSATMILRNAGGWDLLSAGRVDDNKFWAEYERLLPSVSDQA